jgi:hypothetical protein
VLALGGELAFGSATVSLCVGLCDWRSSGRRLRSGEVDGPFEIVT